jgi:IS4 transposase
MNKSKLFTGQPIFNQLLQFVPKSIIRELVIHHQTNRYYKRFKSYEHLVTMLYTCFHGCKSIREVITGMLACSTRINHLGINYMPRRSTLAEANANRSEQFFCDLYHRIYSHYYPDSRLLSKIERRLFIFDSTTISLFSDVMKGGGQKPAGKSKGGVKAHVLIKSDEDVPRFVCLTEAKENDNIFTPMIHLPKGSIVTFDRIYYGFKRLQSWTESSITWVTRMHSLLAYQVLDEKEISIEEKQNGIISDEKILAGTQKRKDKLPARRICYRDPVSQKTLIFLTNNHKMKASTIANIYKKRWQIECLFKRLKQNYPLKYFLGDSENAIKIQIWCALLTDLLIKIVKDKVKRKWSFSNIAAMIRLHLMTYIHLIKFLNQPEKLLINYQPPDVNHQQLLFRDD